MRVEIGVLNRRYLACQISAIKFAKCARSRDFFMLIAELPVKSISQVGLFYHMNSAAIGEKKSPGVSASIGGENHLRFSLAIKCAAIVV